MGFVFLYVFMVIATIILTAVIIGTTIEEIKSETSDMVSVGLVCGMWLGIIGAWYTLIIPFFNN